VILCWYKFTSDVQLTSERVAVASWEAPALAIYLVKHRSQQIDLRSVQFATKQIRRNDFAKQVKMDADLSFSELRPSAGLLLLLSKLTRAKWQQAMMYRAVFFGHRT